MQKNSSYRWVILLLTFLPCFMASVCQFQATAYAGDLMEKYQLSEQAYSTIATAPMLVGVFISFLSGTLGDRFGVKKTVFAGLLITTIGAISRAFAPGYIVMTEIWGISISGYWSTESRDSEKSPKTITPTKSRTVEIGLRTALS